MPQKVVMTLAMFQQSWTEQFYMGKTSVALAFNALDGAFLNSVISWRHPACYIAGIRVSDVDQPRIFQVIKPDQPQPAVTTETPDVKNTTILFRLVGQDNPLYRQIFLRGLRDGEVERDPATGRNLIKGVTAQGVPAYVGNLNRIGAQIRALTPIVRGDNHLDYYAIDTITVDAMGNVTLHAQGGNTPMNDKRRVILSRFNNKQFPGLNGRYTATNVAAPIFAVDYHADIPAGTYATPGARYRQEDFRYATIDLAAPAGKSYFNGLGSRNTRGGPFTSRGRRRPTVRRSQ